MAGQGGSGGMWWIDLIKKGIEDTKGAGFSAIAANQREVDYAPFMNMFQAAGGLAGALMNAFKSNTGDNRTSAIHNPASIDELREEYGLGTPQSDGASPDMHNPSSIDKLREEYNLNQKSSVLNEYSFNRWMQNVMNGANYQSYTPGYAQDNAWV